LIGLGVAGAGGFGLWQRSGAPPLSSPGPLKTLTPASFTVLAAFAARVLPEPTLGEAIAYRVDQALEGTEHEALDGIERVLKVLDNALLNLLLSGRPVPFTRASDGSRDHIIEAWRSSGSSVRRGAYQALRRLCFAAYYADPKSWPGIHYPGPPQVTVVYDDSKVGT
jgi:hypothetical protein